MERCRRVALVGVLLVATAGGCREAPPPAARLMPEAVSGAPGEGARQRVLRTLAGGAIVVVFPGRERLNGGGQSGLARAAASCARLPANIALFADGAEEEAAAWILGRFDRPASPTGGHPASRRDTGFVRRGPAIAVAGYGGGGASAGETVRRILREREDVRIDLLVTVDAIRKGAIPLAKGTTASLVTLDRPIGGRGRSFFAYSAAPRPDGKRFLRHVNYYQTHSAFLRGASIPGASENYEIVRRWDGAVRHGNIDSYAAALVAADLRAVCGGGE